jgi:hypothetical protein
LTTEFTRRCPAKQQKPVPRMEDGQWVCVPYMYQIGATSLFSGATEQLRQAQNDMVLAFQYHLGTHNILDQERAKEEETIKKQQDFIEVLGYDPRYKIKPRRRIEPLDIKETCNIWQVYAKVNELIAAFNKLGEKE